MGEQDTKPVKIDPKLSIQEAMRMYFQPIKHGDPQVDFYAMYRRESMEYDTENMQKYNEDLNTTLIFAGLFSAVSSAFVIDVQSKLQPDPAGRSEAYLRAILLSLNQSIAPDEDPAAPPAWNGPPTEIVTTSDLLYASLLMSLLAAFVAMLGKQWLNRYLKHAGGSVVERCGDRQRKADGLEKWPFRLFIESLPVMLQIALLLLTCGLSRYMWSINTSVARVVISFTVLGIVFYIGIVVAGTSSYECPFQTPASTGLRSFRDNEETRRLFASLSSLKIVSFLRIAWASARRLGQKIGYQIIIQLLRIDRALGNAKQKVLQSVRRSKRPIPLPIATTDTQGQPRISEDGVRQDMKSLRRLNTDNARCVSWILRNVTDPEAIDSAIRLAGAIRWFDGDIDVDLPFDVIVSAFKACCGPGDRVYSGMGERAYLAGRAILQINTRARMRSHECAFKYPIPDVPWALHMSTSDEDLERVIIMLARGGPEGNGTRPALSQLGGAASLWISNLFVDVAQLYQTFSPVIFELLSNFTINHHNDVNVNLLLVWYIFLGGHIEEETFWVVDKSTLLDATLRCLSTRVTELIPDSTYLRYLRTLLEFLAGWEKPSRDFSRAAHDWCSAISEKLRHLDQGRTALEDRLLSHPPGLRYPRDETADEYADLVLMTLKLGFRLESFNFNLAHTSHHHWMFDIIFSGGDDEVIADAVHALAINWNRGGTSSIARHLSRRVERGAPFSPRLRRIIIDSLDIVPRIDGSELEIACLLNHLDRSMGDISKSYRENWRQLLVSVVRSPTGRKALSSHNWRLLGELALGLGSDQSPDPCDVDIDVAILLDDAGDWEKLEVWMLVMWMMAMWTTGPWSPLGPMPEVPVEEIKRETLKLFQRRPSALQRFESLYERDISIYGDQLRQICEQARAEQSPSAPLQMISKPPPVPLSFVGDDTF